MSNGQPIDINQIDPMVKDMIKELRNSIPHIDSNTTLRKVISLDNAQKYVDGIYTNPKGFIARADDYNGVMSTQKAMDTFRLDYIGTDIFPADGHAIIEFKVTDPSIVKVPTLIEGVNNSMKIVDSSPYSGLGFIANNNGYLIPEYYLDTTNYTMLNGAKINIYSSEGLLNSVVKFEDGVWIIS